MTIDQTIALLASIGACVSAVATFFTVRQIAKQREATYRPELALSRTDLEGSVDPILKDSLPTRWVPKSKAEQTDGAWRRFAMPLRNVGLGAAKGVVVSWSLPIAEMVKELNELSQRTLTPAYFEYEGGALSMKSEGLRNYTSVWQNQQKELIDYVLPAAVEKDPVMLTLPDTYILLSSALLFFSSKDKERGSLPRFPSLKTDFQYFDIGGRQHHAVFEIEPQIVVITGGGTGFSGWLQPSKCV